MSRTNRLRPLAGLVAMGLAAPAFADPSVPFPNYVAGPQPDGSWVLGNGQVITPAGTPGRPRRPGPRQGHRAEPPCRQPHRRRAHGGRVRDQ